MAEGVVHGLLVLGNLDLNCGLDDTLEVRGDELKELCLFVIDMTVRGDMEQLIHSVALLEVPDPEEQLDHGLGQRQPFHLREQLRRHPGFVK